MRTNKKILLLALVSFFFLSYIFGGEVDASDLTWVRENYSTVQKVTDATSSGNIEVDQTTAEAFQEHFPSVFQGGCKMLEFSFTRASDSASFTRHMMCKDSVEYWEGGLWRYDPVDPTTIFRPSDTKAECLTTVSINFEIEFNWYYRSNSSKTWVSCFNWSHSPLSPGEYDYVSYLLIAGYWPGYNYPTAYKVEVYLDSSFVFSEFFEVTNGGLNSPRMCEDVDANGHPVNVTSRFTIGQDTKVHHYLRFDKIAYFNDNLECCHNFTTVWIQPNGSLYKTYSGNFSDYKDADVTWNFWEYNCTVDDYISINSSTPVGNWKVEVYLDSYYFNNTWMRYGPIATTPFIVGSEPVADWTFMVYLDADIDIEWAGIDIFEKMADVDSSSQVNIVAQMDRIPDYDDRYGNWTDCKRFNITQGMTPTPENAALNLSETNMGDPDTLKDFVNWTINNYPANYYSLVLWDHGFGCMGLCLDITVTDFLSLPELSQALSGLPVIMDVVFLDACSMSMAEVGYQIKDYANVLIGPEGLGYGPPPYNEYLSTLTSNSSILPSAFAREVVIDYINWCNLIGDIQNATMSAIDLTKITSFVAAIEDFALNLKKKETPYLSLLLATHEQILLARNQTEGFIGPFSGDSGYYVDLYHFAELVNQSVLDEELRKIADQVITTLGSMIIIEANKNLTNSHGLSIFFPNEKEKYDSYRNVYEKTAFAGDTLWDEFLNYHLSGHVLTIQTPYSDIPLNVDNKWFTTDTEGKIRVFVLHDFHTVNVTTPILTGPDSREAFTQWNDNDTSNPRTLFVNRTLTLEAEYETQYYVTIDQSGSPVTLDAIIDTLSLELPISLWWFEGSAHNVSVPPTVSGDSGIRYSFTQWNDSETKSSRTITVTGPTTYTAYYKTQHKVTLTQSGISTDFAGTVVTVNGTVYNVTDLPVSFWWDNGTTLSFAFQSPLVVTPNAKQYVWTSTSGLSSLQSDSITVSTSGNITGDAKTQYYLTVSSPYGTPGGEGWYDNCTTAYATLDTGIEDHLNGTRRVFTYWYSDSSGANYTASNPIHMDGPKIAATNWKTQHLATFAQTGLDTTATDTVATVNGDTKAFFDLPCTTWVDTGDSIFFSYGDPVSSSVGGKRFKLVGVAGPASPVTVAGPVTVTGNYKIQHQVTFRQSGVETDFTGTVVAIDVNRYKVTDLPVSFWWDNGTTLSFAFQPPLVVTPSAKQYVWTSTSGLSSLQSDSITVSTSGNITGDHKTQYHLTIRIDPAGLGPLPNVSPLGTWFDNGTLVTCTAQEIGGRVFDCWTVDGATWDPGVNPITVPMDGPHEATAHYARARAWWETLFSAESLNLIIALSGLGLTVALLGAAWVRTRRKRMATKALLNSIDEVYSRFKTNPRKCKEELNKLRKTILEGLTDGKITQETHDIMDKKIEKYMEELRKQ